MNRSKRVAAKAVCRKHGPRPGRPGEACGHEYRVNPGSISGACYETLIALRALAAKGGRR